MKLSIVIPVLNEAENIAALLMELQALRQRGHEIIVVDGGSSDSTPAIVRPLCDQRQLTRRGRATQMSTGASIAGGDVLWFLHADSTVPRHVDGLIEQALTHSAWGGFAVRLSGTQRWLRIVERLMNIRSKASGILTGDQGIFVRRELFDRVGGFKDIPLMEDIELSARLKREMRPAFAAGILGASSRRWESRGIIRTVLRMWALRLAFYLGVPARYLVVYYV